MEDICPNLAQMKDTAIPLMITAISAADLSAAQPTIAAIHSRVKVLGTKTRPKRLWITSSDGRCQSFLLKVTIPDLKPHSHNSLIEYNSNRGASHPSRDDVRRHCHKQASRRL